MNTRSRAEDLITGTDPDADAFWGAVVDGRLQLRRCRDCGTCFVLPLPSCPACAGVPELTMSQGRGSLYTWVVVRHAFGEEFEEAVPYVVGAVELDEGARVFGRVEGIDPDRVLPGVRLRATFPADGGRPPIVFVPEGSE
ncbi:MAG TPA: OB-fold domain-containing protein [Marmoricola sp.]